jgi:hypothetical protein
MGEDGRMALAVEMLSSLLGKAFDDLRWILEDVDEADCFWEPGEPCWSVRPRAAAGRAWGTGEWVCEDAWPAPDPLPLTTIAWRLAHLAAWTDVYRSHAFGEERVDLLGFDVPGSRDGLVGWLTSAQDHLRAQVDALDDPDLAQLRPAYFGPPRPLHRLISSMVVEHAHHGAEIGLLRDLRRGHARLQPPPPDDAL